MINMGMKNKVGKTESLYQRLNHHVSEAKCKVILYGVGLEKSRTWEDLNKSYLKGVYDTYEECHTAYMDSPPYVKAYKLAMAHVHELKLIELYNLYYEKAKEDVQSFRAFLEFSAKFFEGGTEETELMSILSGVNIDG